MNSVGILEIAQGEFRDAIHWYRDPSPDTARRFALQVKSAISAIREHPTRYSRWDKRHRYYVVNGFPYYVPYRIDPQKILIVAVFHSSRDASAWTDR